MSVATEYKALGMELERMQVLVRARLAQPELVQPNAPAPEDLMAPASWAIQEAAAVANLTARLRRLAASLQQAHQLRLKIIERQQEPRT